MPVSLFVNEKDIITISLFIAESKVTSGFVFCDTDKNAVIRIGGDEIDPGTIETHQVTFRTPSYADSNRILDAGVSINETADNFNISPNRIRSERICTLIKSWTFKDAEGKAVPTTKEVIRQLHPVIAITLGVALEQELRARGQL